MGDHFHGAVYVYESEPSRPSTYAIIKTANKERSMTFEAELTPLHPDSHLPTDWSSVATKYPKDIRYPRRAQVDCEWTDEYLKIGWTTDIGTTGEAHLPRSQVHKPSMYKAFPCSWHEFKERALQQFKHYQYIYRGQSTTLRLRTPFHRTGRGDMRKFFSQDIPALHRHLSARTSHFYNLNNRIENAAFLHLVQHHGYPTPLLDWTYSPFVAAYFAFKRAKAEKSTIDAKVRIFVFDKVKWCDRVPQIRNPTHRLPHFTILEPVSIENERMVPQQALTSYSTVDDIETFIAEAERNTGHNYLQIFDLPLSERGLVLRELRLIGITSGSLFPGLDGACEQLKERFFPQEL
jgi:hypothetical protein